MQQKLNRTSKDMHRGFMMRKSSLFIALGLISPMVQSSENPVLVKYAEDVVIFTDTSDGQIYEKSIDQMPDINNFKFIKENDSGDYLLENSAGDVYLIDPIYLEYEMEKTNISVYCPKTDKNKTAAVTRGVDTCE